MMKKYKVLYYTAVSLSLLVGIWHFTVPYMFQWYVYIPGEYENLIVGIDWINLCMSFFLTATSFLALLRGKSVFSLNTDAIILYGLLVSAWGFRAALALFHPWPAEPSAIVAYGQMAASVCLAAMLVVPLIKILLVKGK